MKKCATIFGVLFAVLLVCFLASVAATGVNANGLRVSVYGFGASRWWSDGVTRYYREGEEFEKRFDEFGESDSVTEIRLETASAKTVIQSGDVDAIEVYYQARRTGVYFGAEIRNHTLHVRESAFFLFDFDFSADNDSILKITVPAREYEKIRLSTASGEIEAKGLFCEKFSAGIASGSGDFGVYAKEISLDVASGEIELENCAPEKGAVRLIDVDCASGKHVIRGFAAEAFDVDLASGNVTLEEISGKGNIDLASGGVTLVYADWNDDLDIDAMSGNVEVRLPAGSGVRVKCDAASGGVTAELDGDLHTFTRGGEGVVGGENRHTADIDLASGNVRFLNRTDEIREEPQQDAPEGDAVPPAEAAE